MKTIDLEPRQGYRRCSRCLLDTMGNEQITFDANGVCNLCHDYDVQKAAIKMTSAEKAEKFAAAIAEIKTAGARRRYDCVMGLSGGRDSSYIAHLAKVHGLRPLVVHLDNGWDAELAVKNIEQLIQKTGFDYYNYVVDWEVFKDIQLAYLKASVIDVEVVTDQAIFALLHQVASRLHVPYILFGDNPATERVMPPGWTYKKNDLVNMRAIHKAFGRVEMKNYPTMGLYDQMYYRHVRGIHYVSLLHFLDFNAQQAQATLEKEYGWRDYKWKHCESIFTKFYQGYILPLRYQIDKRKAHLSDMVLSGQMTREAALKKLAEPYYTEDELKSDYDYVCRKFELSPDEFDALMSLPPVPHSAFPQETISEWQRKKIRMWRSVFDAGHASKGVVRRAMPGKLWRKGKAKWFDRMESGL